MDVVKAVETYITKLISVPPSMKVLLLDGHTVRGLVYDSESGYVTESYPLDTNRIPVFHTVNAPISSGLPDRQDRQ